MDSLLYVLAEALDNSEKRTADAIRFINKHLRMCHECDEIRVMDKHYKCGRCDASYLCQKHDICDGCYTWYCRDCVRHNPELIDAHLYCIGN